MSTTILSSDQGGTGVDNTDKTITIAGNLVVAGPHDLTFNLTGNTELTLPTSGLGTMAQQNGSEVNITGGAIGLTDLSTSITSEPVSDLQLTNKEYVDDAIAAGISPPTIRNVYVTPGGSNVTGDGSYLNPFATILYAYTESAAFATSSDPYVVNAMGVFNETGDLRFVPWVSINGYGTPNTYLNLTGNVGLESGWSGDGSIAISNMRMSYSGSWSIDLTAFGSASATLTFDNIQFVTVPSTFVIKGRDGATDTVIIRGCNFEPMDLVILRSINAFLQNNINVNGIFIHETDNITGDYVVNVSNCPVASGISVQSGDAGATLTVNITDSINGTELSVIDGSECTINIDATSYPATVTPSMATINLVDFSNGVFANYIPTNYSVDATDLHAHLVGIDNALDVPVIISVVNEEITGMEGIIVAFTLNHTPIVDTEIVFWNGVAVPRDTDYYSITGDIITFSTAPSGDTTLRINYTYLG